MWYHRDQRIPLHLQECAKDLNYKIGDMPNSELFSKSMISLPIYPTLSNVELDYCLDPVLVKMKNKETKKEITQKRKRKSARKRFDWFYEGRNGWWEYEWRS